MKIISFKRPAPSGMSRDSGRQVSKDVYGEITVHFRLRPAGWIGNDGWSAQGILDSFAKLFEGILRHAWILRGDETFEITARWRRDGEKQWSKMEPEQ